MSCAVLDTNFIIALYNENSKFNKIAEKRLSAFKRSEIRIP